MRTHHDSRHQSRIVALQRLFGSMFQDENEQIESSASDIAQLGDIKDYNEKLTNALVDGVLQNLKTIDRKISGLATERPIDQMSKVNLQILRLAIFEGFIGKITPQKVAIDEAIELGKEFGGPTSGKFINGVLGKLIKKQDDNKR